MKLLFIGEAWLGSCARSMKEALSRHPEIELDEVAEDFFVPKVRSRGLRAANRLLRPMYRRDFNRQVLEKIKHGQPDFLVTYKGSFIHTDLLQEVSELGVKTVNVYPDCSPHAHGKSHRQAVGKYDLVISTKAYHPERWRKVYGYDNRCVFVPQCYDPNLHLVSAPQTDCPYDVVLIGTYRAEYGRLMLDFAQAFGNARLRVAIGGHGWGAIKEKLPNGWELLGGISGQGYVRGLRAGKICIAPLTRDVVIDGQRKPGDVDTTRSYELAAAYCFFIHQRTDYICDLYAAAGVPMFEDGSELAAKVQYYLDAPAERARIALAAHRTAVPKFSTDARAAEIYSILKAEMTREHT